MDQIACGSCKFWVLRKETKYEDGGIVVNWTAPEGKGRCSHLGIDTLMDFGCLKYQKGGPHIETAVKPGEPWHHKVLGPCPDCRYSYCEYPNCTYKFCPGVDKCLGRGMKEDGGSDNRCVGTGLVFYYDDGYIGENRTKMHPKEAEMGVKRPDVDPTCPGCNTIIDMNWKICPECGHRLKDAKVKMSMVGDVICMNFGLGLKITQSLG